MIKRALALLDGWEGYAAAALLSAVFAGLAAWTAQGWRYGAKISRIETAHAKQDQERADAALAAVEAARNEERRRTAVMEKARDEAQEKARAAAADADGVRTELGRLRRHANTLARAAVARDPAAAVGSPPRASSVDLLAYMLSRVSDRAAELATIADRARIAGLTCERSYDEMRQAPHSVKMIQEN